MLGLFGLFVILALFGVLPDPPVEEKSSAKVEQESPPAEETAPALVEEVVEEKKTDPPPPPPAKQIVWDLSPAEQGLKVGDWITVEGYTGGLIGAEAIGRNGVITGWKWTNNKIWGDMAFIAIVSQPTGLSAPADRIVNIVGFVEKPSSNKEVERVNEAYVERWHDHEKGLVRITGQISQISSPDPTNRYLGQWGMDLETGIYIEHVEE